MKKNILGLIIIISLILIASRSEEYNYECWVCWWTYKWKGLKVSQPNVGNADYGEFIRQCGKQESKCYRVDFDTGEFNLVSGRDEWIYGCKGGIVDETRSRSFVPEGDRIDGYTHVDTYDIQTGKKITTLPFKQSPMLYEDIDLKVSPDGSRIWAEWWEGDPSNMIQYRGVFDGRTYKMIKKEKIEEGKEGTIVWPWYFSEDGKSYYSGRDDTLWVVDTQTGKIIKEFNEGKNLLLDVKAEKALYLVDAKAGSKLGYVEAGLRVLDIATLTYSTKIDISGPMTSLYFGIKKLTPDGEKIVIVVPWEGVVKVFGREKGNELHSIKTESFDTLKERKGDVIYVCPDSSCVIYNNTKELLRFDLREGKLAKRIPIKYPEGCRP